MVSHGRRNDPPAGDSSEGRAADFGEGPAGGGAAPSSRQLLDVLPDAILETDGSGRILWANAEYLDRFGYTMDQLEGQLASVTVGPFADEEEGRGLLELISSGLGESELLAFSRDGVSMPVRIRVRTAESSGDTHRLVVISDETVRARLRTELVVKADAIQREKEILRATTESIEEAVLVVDDSERLVLINQSAAQLLDLPVAANQGQPLANVTLPGLLRGQWLAFLAGAEPTAVAELSLLVGSKLRHVLVQMARVVSVRGTPLGSVMVVTDLSTEARAVESAECFAALSHELRTPLASIQGFISTLLSDRSLDPKLQREFYEILQRDASRLGQLVEGLIELAFLQNAACEIEREAADVSSLVREAAKLVEAEEGIPPGKVAIDVPAEAVGAMVDRERLRRVVVELMRNALRHGWSERGMRVSLSAQRGVVRIRVRDWGPGVPQEEIGRVFDPFSRLPSPSMSRPVTGTGLGLVLCRQVVDRHKGVIHAKEADGPGGLEVEIELPAVES